MTDYTELKRLAEAFPVDLDWDGNTEPFFNGPSGESLGGGATGFYCVYGKPFRLEGDDYDYDGPTYVEACPADFAKFMVAAREGVLALIAENERLNTECKQLVLLECHGGTAEAAINLLAERDQLKAENFQLDAQVDTLTEWYLNALKDAAAIGKDRDQVKAENEALRREREGKVLCDLELFETLRDAANTEADEHRQCMATYRPLRQANLDSVVKKCDDLLAAMGKGE